MDSVLRPRDIQARIRAGESPEDVAAAAQTSVDRIMGFATPVLAERAYQAELAQKASVRRRAATAGPVGHLGQAVDAFLEPHGLASDDVEWDAWRREDGRWTVLATFLSGAAQQTARFTFDPGGRYVVAENDEARTLVGERTAEPEAPAAPTLVPESATELDDEGDDPGAAADPDQLALGDDTLGMVLGRPTTPAPPARPAEPELTEDLTQATGPARQPVAPTADADWIVTQASERPERPERPERAADAPAPAPAPEEHFEEALFAAPEAPATEPPAESPTEPAPVDDAPAAEAEQVADAVGAPEEAASEPVAEEPAKPARAAKARGRASVPSWDEIMFGTPKDQ